MIALIAAGFPPKKAPVTEQQIGFTFLAGALNYITAELGYDLLAPAFLDAAEPIARHVCLDHP
ncbi:MAG: hypothetical protein WAK01_03705 [Methylocystis sp.]